MTRARLAGFDYRSGRPMERTRAEWRVELRELITAGGFRRGEFGETFGHKRGGKIAFEIYARVLEHKP